jgi:hypothetical protein
MSYTVQITVGKTTFLSLADTPSAFTDKENKPVKVNNAGDALEFDDLIGYPKIIEADDTLLYTDTGGKVVHTLPANCVLLALIYKFVTQFNDSVWNEMNIGVTGADDIYCSGKNVGVAVNPETSWYGNDASFRENMFITDETELIATFIGTQGDATQGEVKIYIKYALL